MFTKLNKSIIIDSYIKGDLHIGYGGILNYFKSSRLQDAMQVLPATYASSFYPFLFEISGNIRPHTDSGIRCSINFYIDPGNYKTIFWEANQELVDTYQIKNQTNGKMFSYDSVHYIDSFIANPGDVYLLDVTKPHSVQSDIPRTKRVAFALQTQDFSFLEVKKMLQETGFLDTV